ncbi:MAG: cytidylate kinase-like family protein [Candidatus Riflebacteria bacterium]|nr:cytidylate kinase-like family protein [Candidatus Riflebacteria bacterium]
MPIITVSREIGAGGAYVALKLAEALSYTCVDKELLHEIAKKMGKNQTELTDFDQDTYSRISVFFQEALDSIAKGGRVFHTFGMGPLDWEGVDLFRPYPTEDFEHDEYIDVLRKVVNELAQKGNVILLGRGCQCILKDVPNVFHLRLVADRADRLVRVMEEQKLDKAKAEELITQRDDSARAFLLDFFDVAWGDPHLHHLTINTSRIQLDDCVKLVLKAVS